MTNEHLTLLQSSVLFQGVTTRDLTAMLDCLQTQVRSYQKGETIFQEGERLAHIIVMLNGKAHIQSDDYWGNHSIVGILTPGDLFGEAYVTPKSDALQADIVAASDCQLAFFAARKILSMCSNACPFHSRVVQNLFYVLADQNRHLMQKIDLLAKRTTRAKLTSYLSAESKRVESASFSISFNRQELADYLAVDRSAMSAELSKMRDEGLLDYERSHFTLHH